ncbi:DUF4351 domain-containing protein [Altericista sp. CCNU0014]|uniref:DUF4351 domain-containing protein n=1 Tax=Altericista sp. CCNU0014 TaxID=3082949 RepID=UPI0038505283
MTKNSSDQFSKQFLEEILAPFGTVETSYEVAGEPQWVDLYFIPTNPPAIQELGLLGRMAQTACLIEPFRNQPTPSEVRSCLRKLYQVHGNYQRKARRERQSIQDTDLPQLWILASSASETLLNGFGGSFSADWETGVYFMHPLLKVAIVAINQLPRTEETLFLRLLGKGQIQKQAVDEVIAFDAKEPKRTAILKLLSNWKISLEMTNQAAADEELMMVLSQAYLEWEQQTEQRGRQEGALGEAQALILRQLTRRIGQVSSTMRSQVESLSLPQLESLGEALLDFSSSTDLDQWLKSH